MSQPLGERFFPPEDIIFEKEMSVQNKNLKFLPLAFSKINLSKLTSLFSNFPYYTKTCKTPDRFFQIMDSRTEKHV